MNLRAALILFVLTFIGLLLVIGVRTFIRWLQIHYPRRATAVLTGLCLLVLGAGALIAIEMKEQPTFRPRDLITLQEPVVARTIVADRESRSMPCVVDLHEHLGILDVEAESGTLKARVESNNNSAPVYCPIGADVRVNVAWLHRITVTRRQAENDSP
jgi:hypothetical protein